MGRAMATSSALTVKIKARANPVALTRRFRDVVWRRRAGHRRGGVTIGDLNDRHSRDNRLSLHYRLCRRCRLNHRFGDDRRFFNSGRGFFNRSRFSDRCFRLDSLFRHDVDSFCDNLFGDGFISLGNQLRLFINRCGDSFRVRGFDNRSFRFVHHRHRLRDDDRLNNALFNYLRGNHFRDSRFNGGRRVITGSTAVVANSCTCASSCCWSCGRTTG